MPFTAKSILDLKKDETWNNTTLKSNANCHTSNIKHTVDGIDTQVFSEGLALLQASFGLSYKAVFVAPPHHQTPARHVMGDGSRPLRWLSALVFCLKDIRPAQDSRRFPRTQIRNQPNGNPVVGENGRRKLSGYQTTGSQVLCFAFLCKFVTENCESCDSQGRIAIFVVRRDGWGFCLLVWDIHTGVEIAVARWRPPPFSWDGKQVSHLYLFFPMPTKNKIVILTGASFYQMRNLVMES